MIHEELAQIGVKIRENLVVVTKLNAKSREPYTETHLTKLDDETRICYERIIKLTITYAEKSGTTIPTNGYTDLELTEMGVYE